MICKNCGDTMPDPAPTIVVTEKVREIETSEGQYWVRAFYAAIAGIVLSVAIGCGYSSYESYVQAKAIERSDVKIDFTEYDNSGRVIKKMTR